MHDPPGAVAGRLEEQQRPLAGAKPRHAVDLEAHAVAALPPGMRTHRRTRPGISPLSASSTWTTYSVIGRPAWRPTGSRAVFRDHPHDRGDRGGVDQGLVRHHDVARRRQRAPSPRPEPEQEHRGESPQGNTSHTHAISLRVCVGRASAEVLRGDRGRDGDSWEPEASTSFQQDLSEPTIVHRTRAIPHACQAIHVRMSSRSAPDPRRTDAAPRALRRPAVLRSASLASFRQPRPSPPTPSPGRLRPSPPIRPRSSAPPPRSPRRGGSIDVLLLETVRSYDAAGRETYTPAARLPLPDAAGPRELVDASRTPGRPGTRSAAGCARG